MATLYHKAREMTHIRPHNQKLSAILMRGRRKAWGDDDDDDDDDDDRKGLTIYSYMHYLELYALSIAICTI